MPTVIQPISPEKLRLLNQSDGFVTLHRIMDNLNDLLALCEHYEGEHPSDCECVHCESEFHMKFLVDDVRTLRGVAQIVRDRIDSGVRPQ